MKQFKDFGIKSTISYFQGEKINMHKLLNRQIIVHDFKLEDSKYGKGNEKCLYIQISVGDAMRVVFTGSKSLIDAIQQVNKSDFPFITTIVKENERLEFT